MPRPFPIFSQSDYLIQVVDINSNTEWQTVEVQISWLCQKPTDLNLHYLQRQGISGFSSTRVNEFYVPGAVRVNLKHIILGFPLDNHKIQILVNFVLHFIKWELWKHRNFVKFENRMISENRLFGNFSK